MEGQPEPADEVAGPTLLVVIVNYRIADLVIDCLRSIRAEIDGHPGRRVVVTDNASGDGSVDRLAGAIAERGWGGWVTLMPLATNGGFSAGNNAAIRPAMAGDDPPRYVLLLNPDTVARPGAIGALLAFLEARPDVGLAGSRLEDPDGTPQHSAFPFPSILGELDWSLRIGIVTRLLRGRVGEASAPEEARRVDWVSGACLMARREVFDAIGTLDDGYFMYYEEVDFCNRAARAGWPCWYVPAARVVHLVGRASGLAEPLAPRKRRPRYWFEARRRYFRSNLGVARALLADVVWAGGFATYRARQAIQRKVDVDPDRYLRDFIRYNFLPRGRRADGPGH
jgi:N-acetylglucosaminyl-diphospho-decaprenol L-rhamnosyltransferase